jgi:hypothetical protein
VGGVEVFADLLEQGQTVLEAQAEFSVYVKPW